MKKTTEAFNNYFGNNGSETKAKWENNNGDKEKMPPPRFAPVSFFGFCFDGGGNYICVDVVMF